MSLCRSFTGSELPGSFLRTGTGLTHRLQTMMMTTTAMRKTRPAAAEPMMRGSFSWMLVLYSAIERRNRHINTVLCTHTQSHMLKHMGEHLSRCIWRKQWVTDRHTAGWTNERLGILTGCMDHFPKRSECATDMDKSSGRKCVKWGERACLGETQTDQAAKSRNAATEWAHRSRARSFYWEVQMTRNFTFLAWCRVSEF